jgi:hypothetical protein
MQRVLSARCRVLAKDIQKARRLSAANEMSKPLKSSASTASFGNNTGAPSSSNSPKKIKEEGSSSGSGDAAAMADAIAVEDAVGMEVETAAEVGVGVEELVEVKEEVGVEVGVGVKEEMGVEVGVGVGVELGVGVEELVEVKEEVGVEVGVGVGVEVGVGVKEEMGMKVGVGVGMEEVMDVKEEMGVEVGVGVGVKEEVGVEEVVGVKEEMGMEVGGGVEEVVGVKEETGVMEEMGVEMGVEMVDAKVESESKILSADDPSVGIPDTGTVGGILEEAETKVVGGGDRQFTSTQPNSPDYDELASMLNAHSPVPVSSLLDSSSNRIKIESMGIKSILEEISASNAEDEKELAGSLLSPALSSPLPPPSLEEMPPIIMSGEDLTEDLKRRDREAHTVQDRHSHSTPAPIIASSAVHGGSGLGGAAYMPAARCTDFTYAQTWMDIATQTLLIPDAHLQRDVLDALETLLRDAGRFFLCSLGEDDQQWDDFMKLQNVIQLNSSSHIQPLLFLCLFLLHLSPSKPRVWVL